MASDLEAVLASRYEASDPRKCMGGFCTTSLRWDGSRIWCGHFSWIQLEALVAREECEASIMQLLLGRHLVGSRARETPTQERSVDTVATAEELPASIANEDHALAGFAEISDNSN